MQSVVKADTCLPDGASNLSEQILLPCSVQQTERGFDFLCLMMYLKTLTGEGAFRAVVDLHCKTPQCCG